MRATTALLTAAGAVISVAAWRTSPGVLLVFSEVAPVALGVGCAAGLLSVLLQGAGARPAPAALLPVALLHASYWLPVTGTLRPHVAYPAAVAVLVLGGGAVFALRGRAHRALTVLLAAFTFGSAVAQRAPFRRLSPPAHGAIVLLTLDTLRADHIAGFGGDLPTAHTPHIDAFLSTARVYRHAYASIALTEPSHTTMLSGLGVEEHRVSVNGQTVPPDLPWAPEALQRAGWRTRAVVSASVLDASLGLDRGFDTFDSTFQDRTTRAYPFLNWGGVRNHAGSAESRTGAETLGLVTDFPPGSFTWIHLYDAHWPYVPSPEAGAAVGLDDVTPLPATGIGREMNPSRKTFDPDAIARGKLLYRASLQDLDTLVGRVLGMLPTDASVILTGDHGESLDEHDYVFSHGRLPFAPDVWTPLAVRAPGLAPGWVDTPVSLALIAPTLRALADLPGATDHGLLGPIVARPVLTVAYAEGFLGAQTPHALGPIAGVALREAGRSTAWTRWADPAGYDPVADPRELAPVPIAPEEQDALERAAASAGHAGTSAPEMRGALEALGYLEPAGPAASPAGGRPTPP